MTKRLLCSVLAILLTIGIFPLVTTKSSAAGCYNAKASLEYAKDNWNSGVGLCADYAAACLRAGGIDVPGGRVITLYNDLVSGGYGKVYKLKLTNGKSGSINLASNSGKVKAGDPIFYYCNVCKTFDHVVICNGANSDGYVQDYAHNNAHNGRQRSYTYYHCGSDNWTVYSVRMYDANTAIGQKTSVDTPKITCVASGRYGMYVEWNKISNATFYRVYRKYPGGSWKFLGKTTSTSYADKTAVNGEEYMYTVRAGKGSTLSQYYLTDSVEFVSMVNFTSIKNTQNTITLTWEKNKLAEGYYIYRSVNNSNWKKYATVYGSGSLSYTDKKVENGKTYQYRIRAFDGEAYSSFDPAGIGTTILSTPKISSVTNAVNGVSVKWNNITGAKCYRVYRKATTDNSWTYIGLAKENKYTDETGESGITYQYTVRAVNGTARSGYQKNSPTLKYIATPELVGTQSLENGVELTWSEVEGANGYYIYQKAEDDKKWTRIAVVDDSTEYVDTSVAVDETYVYTARAFNGKVRSSYYAEGIECRYTPETSVVKEIYLKMKAMF